MGNQFSREHRRCGLCYFELEADTPYLEEPPVSRRSVPTYPVQDWADSALDDILLPTEKTKTIELKTSLDAFIKSSNRNCGGCATIVKLIKDQLQESGSEVDETECIPCEVVWAVPGSSFASHSVRIHFSGNKNDSSSSEALFLSVITDTLPSSHIFATKVLPGYRSGDTGSAASLQNAKTWLEECDSSHPSCRERRLSQKFCLPYRVLELSPDQSGGISVRLAQGLRSEEPYACLSHRWGPSTLHCRTTKDTLDTHLQGVSWTKLPKSFQEAIAVTVYLGVKYIWIDSLCIVQDDTQDWKIQAAQMCNIYRGSYVTIAAVSTVDSDDGMFSKSAILTVPTIKSSQGKVFVRKYPGHNYSGIKESAEFPLLVRGWVYQERLLSARTLHFSRYEVRLECLSPQARCECGMNEVWVEKQEHSRMLVEKDPFVIRNNWDEIVSSFSALNLTFQSDRLPALAGIARLYGTTHRSILGRYVAGLWENNLVHNLLWYTGMGPIVQRPTQYSGPSWSWVGTPAQANFLKFQRVEEVLDVIEFNIELAGPDEYGPITDATSLMLRGYLTTGSWKLVSIYNVERPNFYAHSYPSESYRIHIDFDFSDPESPGHIPEGSTIYCLKTGFVGAGNHICLLLRAVDDGAGTFERIGFLRLVPQKDVDCWFEKIYDQRTIKVI